MMAMIDDFDDDDDNNEYNNDKMAQTPCQSLYEDRCI